MTHTETLAHEVMQLAREAGFIACRMPGPSPGDVCRLLILRREGRRLPLACTIHLTSTHRPAFAANGRVTVASDGQPLHVIYAACSPARSRQQLHAIIDGLAN